MRTRDNVIYMSTKLNFRVYKYRLPIDLELLWRLQEGNHPRLGEVRGLFSDLDFIFKLNVKYCNIG